MEKILKKIELQEKLIDVLERMVENERKKAEVYKKMHEADLKYIKVLEENIEAAEALIDFRKNCM